jgi:hypothetical protein
MFVVPYNLPPWECMEESNFMMALLIPGPASPGKDFDLFLEPLVEDLLELLYNVRDYDGLSGKCLIFVLQFCGASMNTQL